MELTADVVVMAWSRSTEPIHFSSVYFFFVSKIKYVFLCAGARRKPFEIWFRTHADIAIAFCFTHELSIYLQNYCTLNWNCARFFLSLTLISLKNSAVCGILLTLEFYYPTFFGELEYIARWKNKTMKLNRFLCTWWKYTSRACQHTRRM